MTVPRGAMWMGGRGTKSNKNKAILTAVTTISLRIWIDE